MLRDIDSRTTTPSNWFPRMMFENYIPYSIYFGIIYNMFQNQERDHIISLLIIYYHN